MMSARPDFHPSSFGGWLSAFADAAAVYDIARGQQPPTWLVVLAPQERPHYFGSLCNTIFGKRTRDDCDKIINFMRVFNSYSSDDDDDNDTDGWCVLYSQWGVRCCSRLDGGGSGGRYNRTWLTPSLDTAGPSPQRDVQGQENSDGRPPEHIIES